MLPGALRRHLRLLVPAVAIILATTALSIVIAVDDINRQRNAARDTALVGMRDEFDLALGARADILKTLANALAQDDGLREAFLARDKDTIRASVRRILEGTDGRHLTGITLRAPDLTVVYRAAAPGLLASAAQSTEPAQPAPAERLSIDPQGQLALGVTVPWIIGGTLHGYLELTQAKDALVGRLQDILNDTVYPVSPSAQAGAGSLPASLLEALGGPESPPARQLASLIATATIDKGAATTLAVRGRQSDILFVRAPATSTVASDRVGGLLLVRDAAEREENASRSVVHRITLWIFGTLVFVVVSSLAVLRITKSLESEERDHLNEREKRLTAVMDAVVDAIVTINMNGTIQSFNPAAETIFGYSASEVIGQNVSILMPAGMAAQHQGNIDRYRATGTRHIIGLKREVRGRRKDGTEFPMDIAVSESRIGGETVFIGVMRDITERKTANDLLLETLRQQKNIQGELHRRSDELVRAAKALTRERDRAEAASLAKSRFLAAMSHELRTPMNGIIGMSSLLLGSPQPAEQRRWAEMIRESGEILLTLLNDILDLSKIEAGRLELRPSLFDPGTLLRQVGVTWEHQAHEKGLALRVENGAPPEGLLLRGDATRIRQVLTNFVSNAIKFTERGFVTLKLNVQPIDSDQVRLRYDVVDTGIGIADEDVPRLFEKFTQLDASVARKYNGTGLGLAICREIATLMGGSVGVDSVPGVGSVFWMELICERVEGEACLPSDAAAADPHQAQAAARLKILIAEDHPVNQRLIEALITHMGHDARLVGSGLDAVEAVRTDSYDLILMDAKMPVMDGVEAMRHIRGLDAPKSRTPIVVVTADAMVGDRERFLDAGFDDYVTKPIDARELSMIIERHAALAQTGPMERIANSAAARISA